MEFCQPGPLPPPAGSGVGLRLCRIDSLRDGRVAVLIKHHVKGQHHGHVIRPHFSLLSVQLCCDVLKTVQVSLDEMMDAGRGRGEGTGTMEPTETRQGARRHWEGFGILTWPVPPASTAEAEWI